MVRPPSSAPLRSLHAILLALTAGAAATACGDPSASNTGSDTTAVTASSSTASQVAPTTSATTPAPATNPSTSTPTAVAPTTTPTAAPTTSSTSTSSSSSDTSATDPSSAGEVSTGGDESSAGTAVANSDQVRDILLFRCGNLICHMPPPYQPPNFALSGDEFYTLLTTYTVAKCAGSALVVPNDTANSAVLKVVGHGCGEFYMPPDTYDPFTEEELATITAWIEAGAPK